MSHWKRGPNSTVYRFENRVENKLEQEIEVEVFDDDEEAEIRLFDEPVESRSVAAENRHFPSLDKALEFARNNWGLDAEVIQDGSTVRVQRLVLSLLADYVGSDVVFGHDVPAETRDALAAAYEALDEPGLPLSFHDCPQDNAALNPLPDDPQLPAHIDLLECPVCDEVYLLNRNTGKLEVRD
jgi:hypothetical protein